MTALAVFLVALWLTTVYATYEDGWQEWRNRWH